MTRLSEKRCQPCAGGAAPLSAAEALRLTAALHPRWSLDRAQGRLGATLTFKNYWRTMAFVNALAWIAHRENHHPELLVAYDRCEVRWWTHAVQGLTENDFICAAKTDALLDDDAHFLPPG